MSWLQETCRTFFSYHTENVGDTDNHICGKLSEGARCQSKGESRAANKGQRDERCKSRSKIEEERSRSSGSVLSSERSCSGGRVVPDALGCRGPRGQELELGGSWLTV